MSKKVTITISEHGWETIVELGDEPIIEKHRKTSFGAQGHEGNFEDEGSINNELYEALSGFDAYGVMKALGNNIN